MVVAGLESSQRRVKKISSALFLRLFHRALTPGEPAHWANTAAQTTPNPPFVFRSSSALFQRCSASFDCGVVSGIPESGHQSLTSRSPVLCVFEKAVSAFRPSAILFPSGIGKTGDFLGFGSRTIANNNASDRQDRRRGGGTKGCRMKLHPTRNEKGSGDETLRKAAKRLTIMYWSRWVGWSRVVQGLILHSRPGTCRSMVANRGRRHMQLTRLLLDGNMTNRLSR